jgi:hypothetical protein
MTVATEYSPLAEMAEEELVNAFIGRDGEEERIIEHPLLLAVLTRRRRGGSEGGIGNPVLAGALLGWR